MTGFASLTQEDETASVGITVRAVNHRFLDIQLRLPPSLADLESRVRGRVQKRRARGRVGLAISLQLRQGPTAQVELQEDFARAVSAAIELARERGLVKGDLTPGDLLRLPQAFVIRERLGDTDLLGDVLASFVEGAVDAALEQLEAMRVREGEHLAVDLGARRSALASLIESVAAASESGRQALEARLGERVLELQAIAAGDPVLIAQEIVRVAQRSDVSEEITRFKAHLAHWEALT